MATQNNKNGRFLGHFQTVSFGLVGKAQEVKNVSSKVIFLNRYYYMTAMTALKVRS